MEHGQKRKVTISEEQPDYTGSPPKTVNNTRRQDGVLYLAGQGPKDSKVMFVAPAIEEDEAKEYQQTTYGMQVRLPAQLLKGDIGTVLKDCALGVGLDIDKYYYTSFIKWLLPRSERNRPTKEAVAWALPAFWNEIREVKPDFIICMGKVAFDALVDLKISATDALGGWFWSESAQARVFLMEKPLTLLTKPEKLEQFRLLFKDVKTMLDGADPVKGVQREYSTVSSMAQLRDLVHLLQEGNHRLLAVDCEWGGVNFVDGRLRSLQICWAPGKAAYIRFRDDSDNYAFDARYDEAGAVLGEWLNRPEVLLVGHYILADLPWMHKWLGLDWYRKCYLDTAFASQCVDEHAPMGLEWLSLMYSDLGRYDLPLLLWRKKNPQAEEDGYAFIPDDILIEYACKDVDVTLRACHALLKRLRHEEVEDYYFNVFHPFVTDVFTSFALHGLPMDEERMDELRDVYQYAFGHLLADFQKVVTAEAKQLLLKRCAKLLPPSAAFHLVSTILSAEPHDRPTVLDLAPMDRAVKDALLPFVEHLNAAPAFNPWSKPQMVRWLFDVKGHVPIKSTDKKEKGIRSMPWEKVLALSPDKRGDYTPATDKQTIQILSENDAVLGQFLDLTAVSSICKSFLKEPVLDDETGEVTRENGLHYWLCSDGRVHGQMGTTETGRPRTSRPNVLNWPSFVNKRIARAVFRVLTDLQAKGRLPEAFRRYLPSGPDEDEAKIPTIRSCVKAPPGWCLVESDYQTAEVRGLAFQSGDPTLIRLMTETDKSFGIALVGGKKMPVRLFYEPFHVSGITENDQDPEVLMGAWKDGVCLGKVTAQDLLRDEKGELLHPKHDLHWSLAEMVFCKPRERMIDKIHRHAGKTGNFSTAYGASENSLERKIEADTGRKPDEGTGKAILDALERRQPKAVDYLRLLEDIPREKGCYVAASGRKRRFHRHPQFISQDNWRMVKSLLSALGREARNFPMQESVAATAARAGIWLLEFGRRHGLEGYQIVILYDSVVTLCPLHERWIWAEAHELYMHQANSWRYEDRVLKYPVDTEFNVAWSSRPAKDIQALWDDPSHKPTPPRLLMLLAWLRGQNQKHQNIA